MYIYPSIYPDPPHPHNALPVIEMFLINKSNQHFARVRIFIKSRLYIIHISIRQLDMGFFKSLFVSAAQHERHRYCRLESRLDLKSL